MLMSAMNPENTNETPKRKTLPEAAKPYRWKKGCPSPNPGGRPKSAHISEALRAALEKGKAEIRTRSDTTAFNSAFYSEEAFMARKLLGISLAATVVAALLLTLSSGEAFAQVVASATGSGQIHVSGELRNCTGTGSS